MKIATYNIQNLFHRDYAFTKVNHSQNFKLWTEEFRALLERFNREGSDLDRLRELAFLMGFSTACKHPYLVLRKRCGRLFAKTQGVVLEPRATPTRGWNGWVELQSYPIHETAVTLKARVITDIAPDVLILQEVEDRASLLEFNAHFLLKHGNGFDQFYFMEGNDTRGLGHGLLSRNGFLLKSLKTHAHELDDDGNSLFDWDCPEYTIITPEGNEITIISVRLQEKVKGNDFHKKRKSQAQKVASFCHKLTGQSSENIVVVGTLQEPSYADALGPLVRGSGLMDICKHPTFAPELDTNEHQSYYKLGAYAKGVNITQKDYVLCSPELWDRVGASGMNRQGVYSEPPSKWRVYPELASSELAASGHPLLYMTLRGL